MPAAIDAATARTASPGDVAAPMAVARGLAAQRFFDFLDDHVGITGEVQPRLSEGGAVG